MIMTPVRAVLSALAFCCAGPALAHEGVHVTDPYARVSGESATSAAVFFVIENHGPNEDRLLSVTTDAAEMAELHTHTEDANGVMSMGAIDGGIAIPGKAQHALDRGGDHVMLMGLTKPLKDGDMIRLTLTFEHEGDVVVEVPVDNDHVAAAAHSGHPATP
jgi:periplasmic copper chaperone A